jgi:cytochrome c-type biogenesis protein CcsB
MVDPGLARLSDTLFWTALVVYAVAMAGFFAALAYRGRWVGSIATVIAWGGAIVHATSVVARGLAADRVPWGNMFEYSSMIGLLLVLAYLLVLDRRLGLRQVGGFAMGAAVLALAGARFTYVPAGPLVPALDSYWIKIHVIAAITGSTLYGISFLFTVLYVVKARAESRATFTGSTVGAAYVGSPPESALDATVTVDPDTNVALDMAAPGATKPGVTDAFSTGAGAATIDSIEAPAGSTAGNGLLPSDLETEEAAELRGSVPGGGFLSRFPSASTFDTLAFRTIQFAFPIWTFAVMAGAIWAHEAWGRYWGWDPKETWAFVTWVVYAGYLHARSTAGWRGMRSAAISSLGFACVVFTYFAVNLWIAGLHSYAK